MASTDQEHVSATCLPRKGEEPAVAPLHPEGRLCGQWEHREGAVSLARKRANQEEDKSEAGLEGGSVWQAAGQAGKGHQGLRSGEEETCTWRIC